MDVDEVYPRMYMSGWQPHSDKTVLLDLGITHVVQCFMSSSQHNEFKYLQLDFIDNSEQKIIDKLDEVC